MKRPRVLALALVLTAAVLSADAVVFTNGDRISGKIVAKGTKRIKIKTAYGRLEIPRTEIERLVWDDGREEILNAPPAPPAPRTTYDIVLSLRGHTFWQAWDPGLAPADPSLRLSVTLDGQEVATYTDVNLDPQDLPGALVNSFVFAPERLFVSSSGGVLAMPPEPAGGQIRLALEVPAGLAGSRRLGVAYQLNDATSADPDWRDVVRAEARVELSPEAPVHVRIEQDRGMMEFKQDAMQQVESFRAVALVISPAP